MWKHLMAEAEYAVTDRVGQHFGNYQLVKLLGRGGFAEVYLGKHRYLNGYAALKILHSTINPVNEQQFLAEAQTLVDLRHPNIVRLLDFSVENGTPVLIMDYAPKGSLRQLYPHGTQVELATVVSFVEQIATALQYAHNHHVIHRDVKPENVLLDADDRLLLSDFGLSLLTPSSQELSTQDPVGTPRYTAPEQLLGKPSFASDQYALGVMVYEWICGTLPFRGTIWQLWQQHMETAPPPLRTIRPTIPLEVERVVLRSLAKDPQDRFVSVRSFAQALARASQTYTADDEHDSQVTAPLQAGWHTSLIATPDHPVALTPQNRQVPETPARPPTPAQSPGSPGRSSNRLRLLAKVRTFWIAGVLEHSLQEGALITLGLSQQAEAVANPWNLVFQKGQTRPDPLPTGTHILEVYDATHGELLILGEPGSGKTTLLLELTRQLLDRAEHDETHPIPVIFNLSSWASKKQPLTSWLIEELNSKYQVPRKLGHAWVMSDNILPLLDGFDEVLPEARAACMDAINDYRHEHGMLPTVVCSRSSDYFALGTRVQLSNAVVIQPLTGQQVDDYLARGGEPLWALRVALHKDETLRELTTTPLMLSILILTYHGMPVEDLLRATSPETLRHQIFEHYVGRMLIRKEEREPYTAEQTIRQLSWLALQLKRHGQTVFYIERIQPDWLPGRWSYWLYHALAVWPISALIGLLTGIIIGGLPLSHTGAINGGLVGLLVSMLTSIKIGGRLSENIVAAGWSRLSKIIPAISGAILGLVLVIPNEMAHHIFKAIDILPISLHNASIGLLVGVLVSMKGVHVQPVETIIWSWRKFTKFTNIRNGLLVGLIILLIDLVLSLPTLMTSFSVGLTAFFSSSRLIFLVSGTLVGWLISGLVDAFSSTVLEDSNRVRPNQGIHNSARNTIQVGLIVGLTSGLLIVLALLVTYWQSYGSAGVTEVVYVASFVVSYGPIVAVAASIISGLLRGGDACIKHIVLRLQLWATRRIPWRYSRFLDYATTRILLRKVGGGYMFIHRLLLEHFTSLETRSRPDV